MSNTINTLLENILDEILLEKKRTKKEQKAIDAASMDKYGMIWRSTPTGVRLGIGAGGELKGGNKKLLKKLMAVSKPRDVKGKFSKKEDVLGRLALILDEYTKNWPTFEES